MIKKYICDNGVRIVTENIESVRSITIGIWVLAGSRNETKANNGISHFIEHMFFKGTSNRTARDIAEAFDSIGGQVNAFTSKEYTCFYARVLDNHGQFALEVLADMFFNSTFAEEELIKEKKVVLEEIKMYEDTPDDIVHDLLSEAIYKDHPLGYPILGTENNVNNFTRETIEQYIEENYRPENVVISIAGNLDDTLIEVADKLFGNYSRGPFNSANRSLNASFQTNAKLKTKNTEQAHLCVGFDGLNIGHDDIYSLVVLNNILGGSMSSRLFQEVREQHGLAYAIFSYHTSFQDTGLITIYGGTAPDQLNMLYDTINKTLTNLQQNGITNKELNNSKEQIKGNLMLSLESTSSRMSRNGKNELLLKRHRSLDEIVRLIDIVSEKDVNELANKIFTKNCSLALVGPTTELPTNF